MKEEQATVDSSRVKWKKKRDKVVLNYNKFYTYIQFSEFYYLEICHSCTYFLVVG